MTGETLIWVLPFLALILVSISIAGLWLWWNATKEQPPEALDDRFEVLAETKDSKPVPEPAGEEDPTVGQLFNRIVGTVQTAMPASSKPEPAPPSAPVAAPPLSDGESIEVMRLLRDLASGGLIVEIGGQRYYHLSQIADPQIRRRFLGNAQSLAQFTQGAEAETTGPIPPVAGPPPESPTPPPITTGPPGPRPSVLRRGAAEPEEAAEEGPKTIADQIEELLQYRLTLTPTLSDRSIHIRPAVDGGVRIEVDGRVYGGVDDVEDEEIQAFIRSTIHEWEARQ
jgi:hypothetical protein